MSSSPTISVLMSVYNGERYLRPAVDSILAQKFADFEFVIIDDGSKDASPAILREYAARDPRVKARLKVFDHCAIYLLIAGTYTPFMLTVLKGATGMAMLCAVWSLGALGIVSKTVLKLRSDTVSIPFYLLMGWMGVAVIEPFSRLIDGRGLVLLVAGGLCYSVGIVFFLGRFAYAHAVWHGFVLAGSALHYVCVLLYATPS